MPEYIIRQGPSYRPDAVYRNTAFRGTGVLAGLAVDSPNGPSPDPVDIRVLLRHEHPDLDGRVVAKTTTTVGATFSVEGVDGHHEYDVVGRLEDRRDQIVSRVKPFDDPRFAPLRIPVGIPLDIPLPVIGGKGTVTASYVSGSFPTDVTLVGDRLQGTWPTGTTGVYPVTFELTDSIDTYYVVLGVDLYLIPLTIRYNRPVPVWLQGEIADAQKFFTLGGEGPYVYSISAGTLPAGLTLDTDTGVISGTIGASYGFCDFDVTATDIRSNTTSTRYENYILPEREYWRIMITASDGASAVQITELELHSRESGNLATGGTPSASSKWNGAYGPSFAFNGIKTGSECWSSAANFTVGVWLQYRFASPVSIDRALIWSRSINNTAMPREFAIQSSEDGVRWTTEWTVVGQTAWANNQLRTFVKPIYTIPKDFDTTLKNLQPWAYWKLDDAGTPFIDDTSNARHLETSGGTISTQQPDLGDLGLCVSLNSGYIQSTAYSSDIVSAFGGNLPWSVVAVVANVTTAGTIFHLGNNSISNNQGFAIAFSKPDSNWRISISAYTGSWQLVEANLGSTLPEKMIIVCTRLATGSVLIYINSNPVVGRHSSIGNTLVGASSAITIGASYAPIHGGYLTQPVLDIGHVALFNRELNVQEVHSLSLAARSLNQF